MPQPDTLTGGPRHWLVRGDPSVRSRRQRVSHQVEPADSLRRVTYSIFTSTGNLVDAFDDRNAAVAALTEIVRAEREAADEVFLVAQDDEGHVGETVYGLSLHVTA